MHTGLSDGIASDKAILHVRADVVFVAKMTDAMFLCPSGISVFLRNLMRLVLPRFGNLAVLDLLILFAGVALLRHRDERCIDNLSALGFIAMRAQIPLKLLKKGLYQSLGNCSRSNHTVVASGTLSVRPKPKNRMNDKMALT